MKHATNLLMVLGAFALMALATLFTASCDENGGSAGGDSDTDSDVDSDSDTDVDTDTDTDVDTDSDTDTDTNHYILSVGSGSVCAVVPNSGVLKCWGNNYSGELGNGTNVDSPGTAVEVLNIGTGVKSVSVDDEGDFACAVTAEGSAKCWGRNLYGELGDGTENDSNVPVNVMGLVSGVIDIEACCAVTSEGKIKCWGDSTIPTEIPLATDAIQVSGLDPCFLQSSGAVKCGEYCWSVEDLDSGVAQISVGGDIELPGDKTAYGCALLDSGEVKCWEKDYYTNENPYTKVWTMIPSGAKEISITYDHACALMDDGHAKCWGNNDYGQLGDGTTTSSTEPVDVTTLDDTIATIDVGGLKTCVLTAEGKAKCWGGWDGSVPEAFEIADF